VFIPLGAVFTGVVVGAENVQQNLGISKASFQIHVVLVHIMYDMLNTSLITFCKIILMITALQYN